MELYVSALNPEERGNVSLPSESTTVISGGTAQKGMSDTFLREDEWGKAQQRLILYLQSLKVPPFEVLELALEALKRAREKPETVENGHPVTASMRALREILSQRKPTGPLKAEIKQMMPDHPFPQEGDPFLQEGDPFRGIQSMPPLNRGSMIPERANQKLPSHQTSQPDAF